MGLSAVSDQLSADLSLLSGCGKMSKCKAREILRNEAYVKYVAMTKDERNAADGRFSERG